MLPLESPRHSQEQPEKLRHRHLVLARTLCLCVLGIALPLTAWVWIMPWYGGHALLDEAAFTAAVLWLIAGLTCASWLLTRARHDQAFVQELPNAAIATNANGLFGRSHGDERVALMAAHDERLRHLAGSPQVLLVLPMLVLAGVTLIYGWTIVAGETSGGTTAALFMMVCAFALLIAERLVVIEESWQDSERVAAGLRAGVMLLCAAALTALVGGLGVIEVVWGQRVLFVLLLLVLGELLLRAPLALLRAPHGEVQVWCHGTLLVRLGRMLERGASRNTPPVINFGRSWAVRFVRSALAPTLVGVVFSAWLASGVTVLDVGSRALLQRLDEPSRVLHPGLHFHLPWPFAQVRRIDFGQVHQTNLASTSEMMPTQAVITAIAAEDDPPEAFDRLWERAHPAESTFLLPAPGQPGRAQAMHLVNSDTRIVWRIGLDDGHAIAAGTRVHDADVLVRRLSARALTEAFQERSLEQLLSSDRDRLAVLLRNVVQRDLDQLDTGIEVIAFVVDALHPPTSAAGAYHGVQAAGITAASEVLSAETGARRRAHEAEQNASVRILEAEAAAVEQLTKARSERVRFVADATTAQTAGTVLELERWLQNLGTSLKRSPLVIIDHRIPREQVPFLDYRASANSTFSPGDAAIPGRRTP